MYFEKGVLVHMVRKLVRNDHRVNVRIALHDWITPRLNSSIFPLITPTRRAHIVSSRNILNTSYNVLELRDRLHLACFSMPLLAEKCCYIALRTL